MDTKLNHMQSACAVREEQGCTMRSQDSGGPLEQEKEQAENHLNYVCNFFLTLNSRTWAFIILFSILLYA